MAENLWRWHRQLAVVAISLMSALWVNAQEPAENDVPQPPVAAQTALQDLRVSAIANGNEIEVAWRFVSNGKSVTSAPLRDIPQITLPGIESRAQAQSYKDEGIETVLIVMLSGRDDAELAYMLDTSAAAVSALPGGNYRLLIRLPDGQWAKDMRAQDGATLSLAFDPEILRAATPGYDKKALAGAYGSAILAIKSASPKSRAAIIVPEPLLPGNTDLLSRLSAASYVQRTSFFPVAPQGGVSAGRAQQMIDFAGPSGGRFIPDALQGRPKAERAALFTEFRSGASRTYALAPKDIYILPFEEAAPIAVQIDYETLSDTLNVGLERPKLRGLSLAGAVINPAYWGRWLVTPGRRIWGAASLVLWLAFLAIITRLIIPPVKVYAQIAGDDKIQKIRRLPASIGRSAERQIRLDHAGVSRDHAMIEKGDKQLVLRDLGSTNGTFIAGERIEKIPLRTVQTVQFGPVKLILRTKR